MRLLRHQSQNKVMQWGQSAGWRQTRELSCKKPKGGIRLLESEQILPSGFAQHRIRRSHCESLYHIPYSTKQYRFFKKNPSVLLPSKPRRNLQGLSWGFIVIVLIVLKNLNCLDCIARYRGGGCRSLDERQLPSACLPFLHFSNK